MKSAFGFAGLFALLGLAIADNTCGGDCYSSSVADSVCGDASDWICLCKDSKYLGAVNSCVQSKCTSANDQLVGYYTLWQICHIFAVPVGGLEQSAADVASTSSITGLPNDLSSFSALTSGVLTGPGIIGVSVTSQPPPSSTDSTINPGGPNKPITIESTLTALPGPSGSSNMSSNPGGPMSSASSSALQSNPGGPAGPPATPLSSPTLPSSSSSAGGSTQPGGPIQSATTPATSSTTGSSSSAAAGLHVELGCMLVVLTLLVHVAVAL